MAKERARRHWLRTVRSICRSSSSRGPPPGQTTPDTTMPCRASPSISADRSNFSASKRAVVDLPAPGIPEMSHTSGDTLTTFYPGQSGPCRCLQKPALTIIGPTDDLVQAKVCQLSLFQPYPDQELVAATKRIRRSIIEMVFAANSGHPGGALSSVEILASLYLRVMRHDPENASWPDRDRFILSKAHAVAVLYGTLAECGYFPRDEIYTFRKIDSRLQGHSKIGTVPGVEMSGGSLGQGLSYSIGQCIAGRMDGRDYRVYCLLGDGELNEGQVWEAAMAAPHHGLANLTAIVDRNHIQNDGFGDYERVPPERRAERPGGRVMENGYTANIMNLEPLADKWRAFGWNVLEVDGHDVFAVAETIERTKGFLDRPSVVIAHTVKGKGVSYMENNPSFHGKAPTPEEKEQALAEIGS
jgi:transketolase